MIELIREKLFEIEQTEHIRILHCVESGSRAWGFASPDSDYDVRFIYVRPLEDYLRLEKRRDVIEWQLDETLDINGWDVQKALRLLHGSNPTLFEWNLSPIVYKTTKEWAAVSAVMDEYFKLNSGLHHYLSTAKRTYHDQLKGDTVKLKKYFYALRPLLACRWILEFGTPPPMLFSVLKDRYLSGAVKTEVERLLDIKVNTPERRLGERIDIINAYLDAALEEIEGAIGSLPPERPHGYEKLNALFLELVGGGSKK